MKREAYRSFTKAEHHTWTKLYNNLEGNRAKQAAPLFTRGIKALNITAAQIPDVNEVNRLLESITGWKGVPVEGLEEGLTFFPALALKQYPIGNFIRSAEDLAYTPAPDVFHDLYGHMPFFADTEYAHFCESYGKIAEKYVHRPEILEMFERVFWYGLEFSLVESPQGLKIFGAGLLSSYSESDYALSKDGPKLADFDLAKMIETPYNIDTFQPLLFVLKSPSQLYSCLGELEATARKTKT